MDYSKSLTPKPSLFKLPQLARLMRRVAQRDFVKLRSERRMRGESENYKNKIKRRQRRPEVAQKLVIVCVEMSVECKKQLVIKTNLFT